jgi:Ferrochelatase
LDTAIRPVSLPAAVLGDSRSRSRSIAAAEDQIRDCVEKLERHFGHLIGCRAAVELLHRQHKTGNLYVSRRARLARGIYERLGGGSPLLANTLAQARALEAALGSDHRCFVAMRYWHPLSEETARDVAEWEPREIVCSRFTRNSRRPLLRWRLGVLPQIATPRDLQRESIYS